MRLLLVAIVTLLLVPAATAKDFQPGDIRLCDRDACVEVTSLPALKALSRTIYTGPRPRVVAPVTIGGPTFELQFSNGYVTGLVGGAKLDRFLSYGVYLGRFQSGKWHRVEPRAAAELGRLAAVLDPIPLTRAAVDRSR